MTLRLFSGASAGRLGIALHFNGMWSRSQPEAVGEE